MLKELSKQRASVDEEEKTKIESTLETKELYKQRQKLEKKKKEQ